MSDQSGRHMFVFLLNAVCMHQFEGRMRPPSRCSFSSSLTGGAKHVVQLVTVPQISHL